MKRAVDKRVLLQKQKDRGKRRSLVPAGRVAGSSSLYEEIRRRGGQARVCVIRSVGGIGDVLMTTPVLMHLKREFPSLVLTYAVDRHRTHNDIYFDLVKNAGFIDDVIDARYVDRSKYDAVVDISSVCIRYERKGLPVINRIDLFARACGVLRLRKKLPFYQVEPNERLAAQTLLSSYRKAGKRIVALHSASFEDKRCWPVKNYLDLIKHSLVNRPDIQFVILDYQGVLGNTKQYANCLDASVTTVRELAALIAECDLFIGPDSGPMHIAGALKTKSLVLFGSIPPEARINYYPTHTAITLAGLSCLGCWYASCPINIRCMTDIASLTVYDKMIDKLSS